jgi:serine/threonine protein phosphatase PrpC
LKKFSFRLECLFFNSSRNGQAVRISRDHKPNDEDEARRIVASGGFVGNHNRVNGILAVSRALGDHMLKPFVSAEPTISVTNLKKSDLFMIIACDGVRFYFLNVPDTDFN